MSRTESLLKAAGLLDENSNYDEFANGEGEQLESDSEREHENENDQSSPNWKAKLNRERTRRNASLGQNPGSAPTTGNSHQNSFLPVARNHPASGIERRRSLPGSSNIQHVPVLSFDGREESRYYGSSIFLLSVDLILVADTSCRTFVVAVHIIPRRDRMDQGENWRCQICQLSTLPIVAR